MTNPYFSRDLIEEVIGHCTGLLTSRPNDVTVLRDLALAYENKGDHPNALATFNRLLTVQPGDPATLIACGRCHLALGAPDRAEADLLRAQQAKPEWVDIFYWLAEVAIARNDLPKAIEYLNKALSKNPKYREAHQLLATVFKRSGRFEEAVIELEKVIDLIDPDDRTPFPYDLKTFFEDPVLLEEIIKQLEAFLQQNPDGYADLHFKLGLAYRHKGMKNESLGAFARAIRINPHYHQARHFYWHWDEGTVPPR